MSKVNIQIDKDLLDRAREYFASASDEELAEKAFSTLIHVEAGRWIFENGGTEPDIEDIPRRRWERI
ncbi:type II toxin-antitoxin system VapB family antitoxin [Pseudoduganella violacea]|uniref:Type II toxin-antitoxin system VapB family antitoxin n=1 Tax=Pseudoduganella violacea TaxID=1715466 RepID=A0A7W5FVC5_9BURK|nr:type II toxin-antitoxin system VapB family antitoxin [Pseudoduganella violacea]MBB3120860.1 hypothetical protein [Pseudoduganella violacea]